MSPSDHPVSSQDAREREEGTKMHICPECGADQVTAPEPGALAVCLACDWTAWEVQGSLFEVSRAQRLENLYRELAELLSESEGS
jgi:hypothetical protein